MRTHKNPNPLANPSGLSDMLLFRLNRLRAIGGGMVLRYCEGRFGITRCVWVFLALLTEASSLSSSELAQLAGLDRSATSKTVTTLLRRGLISRVSRRGDRRNTQIELTQAGTSLYSSILPLVAEINERMMASLSAAEIAQLDDLLTRIQSQSTAMLDAALDLPLADRRKGEAARHRIFQDCFHG